MADLRCPICGEPWDIECLHDEVAYRYPDKPWYSDTAPITKNFMNRFDTRTELWYDHTIYEALFNDIRKAFSQSGCVVLTSYTSRHNEETISPKNGVFGALMEFAGDDVDFAVSMIEDAENYGLLD